MRSTRNIITWLLLAISGLASAADDEGFAAYLAQVKQLALDEGISTSTVNTALDGLVRDERVIGFDRRQPEFVQTFKQYLSARVTNFRKQEGLRLLQHHKALLAKVKAAYGVEPEYIVAFWGLETSFGRYQGKYSIVRSLATLGHDPRRSGFFTNELIKALRILDEGHIPADRFVGAWAGAMGQSQFMPGSFLSYAQDFDRDGKKNIWQSEADVFASIANYLRASGWETGQGWGRAVELPVSLGPGSLQADSYDTSCRALKHHTRQLPAREWRAMGLDVTGLVQDRDYALVNPDEGVRTTYLVGGNFRSILRYNCANKYAVSVGLLADYYASQESS
jgi:membrane-bound lytic murein transglycosylase B